MKIEVSSGGVVYRKRGRKTEILLLRDHNDEWTFPKGLVEEGEDKVETAKREIAEEVGLENIDFVSEVDLIQYFYRWQGELVKKTVYYYLFKFTGIKEPKPQEEEGIKEARWFSPKKALRVVGYKKTNERVLKKAINITPMN